MEDKAMVLAEQIAEKMISRLFGENADGRFIDINKIKFICKDIEGINKSIGSISDAMETRLVTQDQFWPVKTLVYGFVAIVLTAVVVAIVSLVVVTIQ